MSKAENFDHTVFTKYKVLGPNYGLLSPSLGINAPIPAPETRVVLNLRFLFHFRFHFHFHFYLHLQPQQLFHGDITQRYKSFVDMDGKPLFEAFAPLDL